MIFSENRRPLFGIMLDRPEVIEITGEIDIVKAIGRQVREMRTGISHNDVRDDAAPAP